MLMCGDFAGALTRLLWNDINPLVTLPVVLINPLLAVGATMLAALFSLMACFQ